MPAFLAFILTNRNKEHAGKFLLYSFSIPIFFTVFIFSIFQWDILFFLRTVFYSTPVFETSPVQILGGCMNMWSFIALPALNIDSHWIFRLIWIPLLSAGSLYWLRKKKMGYLDLAVAIVSLYLIFMISYGWVSEQLFLDPLPFIFLTILVFRPGKLLIYFLVLIQVLVFAFSMVNWGPFIFEPLINRFSPKLLHLLLIMNPSANQLIWNVRGVLGLLISLLLGTFLFLLLDFNDRKITENVDNSLIID